MTLKIIRTSTIPTRYLHDLYRNRIVNWQEMKYSELRTAIFGYFIHEFDQYSHYLNLSGRYHMEELILNDEILQRKWADENGVRRDCSMDEIFIEQMRYYKPTLVYDNNYYFMKNDALKCKKDFGVRGIIAWDAYTGSKFDKQSRGVDVVLTCVEYIRSIYGKLGFRSVLLPFAFDRRVYDKVQSEKDVLNQVCFAGTISDNVHRDRKALLMDFIAAKIPFSLHISNLGKGKFCISRAQIRALKDRRLDDFFDYFLLQSHNLGGVYGRDMFKTLGSSSIQLNIHGDNSLQAGNMRLYEATGMGSLLLTDWKSNIADIFDPEKEIVTFRNNAEAIEKATYFLNHPKEAQAIAKNAQARTFSQYSAESRVKRFEVICNELLS